MLCNKCPLCIICKVCEFSKQFDSKIDIKISECEFYTKIRLVKSESILKSSTTLESQHPKMIEQIMSDIFGRQEKTSVEDTIATLKAVLSEEDKAYCNKCNKAYHIDDIYTMPDGKTFLCEACFERGED